MISRPEDDALHWRRRLGALRRLLVERAVGPVLVVVVDVVDDQSFELPLVPDEALNLFETAVDSLHRAGNVVHLVVRMANLAVLLDRMEQPVAAATLYGSTRHGSVEIVLNLPSVVEHLRSLLGESAFDQAVANGAGMKLSDAVQYARQQIQAARHEPTEKA